MKKTVDSYVDGGLREVGEKKQRPLAFCNKELPELLKKEVSSNSSLRNTQLISN